MSEKTCYEEAMQMAPNDTIAFDSFKGEAKHPPAFFSDRHAFLYMRQN